jgi:hypothetical protein
MVDLPRVLNIEEQLAELAPHRVVYAQGEDRVVCSCGVYFTTPAVSSMVGPPTGLAQWARHQARLPA